MGRVRVKGAPTALHLGGCPSRGRRRAQALHQGVKERQHRSPLMRGHLQKRHAVNNVTESFSGCTQ
jgi:hypothetical protein